MSNVVARKVVSPLGGGQLVLQLSGPAAYAVAGGSNLASLTTSVGNLSLGTSGGGITVQAADGNVGIGKAPSGYALDVSGSVNARVLQLGTFSSYQVYQSPPLTAASTSYSYSPTFTGMGIARFGYQTLLFLSITAFEGTWLQVVAWQDGASLTGHGYMGGLSYTTTSASTITATYQAPQSGDTLRIYRLSS